MLIISFKLALIISLMTEIQTLFCLGNKIDNQNKDISGLPSHIYKAEEEADSTSNGYYSKDCVTIDGICLRPYDVPSYEAIRTLHAHLDDDHSGDIDLSESVEFLRDELNYTKGLEKRQEAFHPNNDHHISVKELWQRWHTSEVYNWSVETTVVWLCTSVELGQYTDIFYENDVNGSVLPRLAANSEHFLTRILGIKSATHKSKISIKAMDIVLFGAPKDTGSYVKDVTIACLFILLLAGIVRFYHVQQNFEKQRVNMMHEMNLLHEEEKKFREELKHLKETPPTVTSGYNRHDSITSRGDGRADPPSGFEGDDFSIQPESEWDCSSGHHTFGEPLDLDLDQTSRNLLQLWLQLTYERERVSFEGKCTQMEERLVKAKELCEKLNSTKKQLFGALVVVHSKIESKYQAITQARESFNEITVLHKEKKERWEEIEKLLGFSVIENPGLVHLEFLLEPNLHQTRGTSPATSSTTAVQHLLRSQSALIYLTMGGYSGLPAITADAAGRMSANSSIRSYVSASVTDVKTGRRPKGVKGLPENAHDLISLRSASNSTKGHNNSSSKIKMASTLTQSQTVPEDFGSYAFENSLSAAGETKGPKGSSEADAEEAGPKFLVGNCEIEVSDTDGAPPNPDSVPAEGPTLPPGSGSRSPSEKQKGSKSSSEPSLEVLDTCVAGGGTEDLAADAGAADDAKRLAVLKLPKRGSFLRYRSAKAKLFNKFKTKSDKTKTKGVG